MTVTQQLLDGWTFFLNHVEHPKYLWAIPFLIIVVFWLLRRDFVKLAEDMVARRARRRQQWVMLFTRSLIIAALTLALASPFLERTKTVEGDPFLKILVDHSQSMGIYSDDVAETLKAKLEQVINVELHSIASGPTSNIGDGILNAVKDGDNVVLVTDGQVTNGASLGDVALFAASHNITFNAIDLRPKDDDAWILVSGPEKTVANVDNTFTISTGWASGEKKDVHVTIKVDGKIALDVTSAERTHLITQKFEEGYHQIEARVQDGDFLADNNVFYKTVKVVPKPKVVLWTPAPNSPMETLLRQVYDVTTTSSLPADLSPYYSVVTNDLSGASISDDDTARLSEFIEDGNGMFVVGGKGSYNNGGYRNSYFETILPVVVGTPGKEPGDVNIVILIDASQSVGAEQGGGIAIAKKLALDIVSQMSPNVKVGVTAFRNIAYIVAPLGYKYEHVGLEDKITQIYGAYSSKMHLGILQSVDLLKGAQGSKNIIIISDGMLFPNDQVAARDATLLARKNGIKVYTVSAAVGDDAFVADRTDEDLLKSVALAGGGIYFKARDTSKFNLLFGDVKPPDPKAVLDWGVSVLDANHFITQDLNVTATIYGYNEVAPKTTGRMLVVTSTGEPIVTIWHLGLGRVVSYSTDDGSAWAGQLLAPGNSRLVIRGMNWANGDPDRKRSDLVDVRDTRVNEATTLTIKSAKQPTAQGLAFFKVKQDTYEASVTPKETGFHSILGATYAANHPAELSPLGLSKELDLLIGSTGGDYFSADDVDKLVDFAQTHAVKTIRGKDYLRWQLALLAAGIFLLEILLRRLMRR